MDTYYVSNKIIEQLRFYLHDETLDVLSINESRLDDNVDESQIKIDGYEIVRNDRNREGGGVAIYYRDYLNVKIRDDLAIPNLEVICLEVNKFKCKPLLVASIYRPPSAQIELFDKINDFIKAMDTENKDIVIVGDVNCNLLDKP